MTTKIVINFYCKSIQNQNEAYIKSKVIGIKLKPFPNEIMLIF